MPALSNFVRPSERHRSLARVQVEYLVQLESLEYLRERQVRLQEPIPLIFTMH